MNRKEVKIDCHVHSRFSPDSLAWVYQIEKAREERGLDGVAITDHNFIPEIAKDLKENSDVPFILGEEIITSDKNSRGKKIELIGLFLQELIEPDLGIPETILQINDQGGIVVIPHPFEEWRHGAGEELTRRIITTCEGFKIPVAIEVFNARAKSGRTNHQAMNFYRQLKKEDSPVLATAGSDAHRIPEIGRGHVLISPFETREEFIEALKYARVYGEVSGLGTLYHRLMNRIELAMDCSLSDLRGRLAQDFNYR